MKICIVYVYAGIGGKKYVDYALRFVQNYKEFPPGIEHESVVMLNGVPCSTDLEAMFNPLQNLKFLGHDNSGYDIGAFQHAAREVPADMMVFFGASAFLQVANWLLRMAQVFSIDQKCQYGCMGNVGLLRYHVWPHIRTTGFWMNPTLMNSYPIVVTKPEQRFPFEHGPNCFTEWLRKKGIKSYVVTTNGVYDWKDWNADPNGFQRGNQSSLLSGDRMCEPPYYPARPKR